MTRHASASASACRWGDNVYPDGTSSQFNTYYEPTWGRHKARTRPSPGNHDYHTYDWQFVPEAGKTYSDSGTSSCH